MIFNQREVPEKLRERMQTAIALVDDTRCVGCSYCHLACPYDTITMRGGLAVIEPHCTACWVCVSHCPVDAIGRGTRDAGEKGSGPFSWPRQTVPLPSALCTRKGS